MTSRFWVGGIGIWDASDTTHRMGNSPAVVFEVCRLAERKGYITRKGA